jgi:elongation factor G
VPATIDYTHKKQSGGSGQYAKVVIEFSPIEKAEGEDSGAGNFEFVSEIKGGTVPKEYIPGVAKGLESVLGSGVRAGFPVVGVRAKLIDGAFHDVDSSVMAFEIASKAACRQGLTKAKSRLMEPIMRVDVVSPDEFTGDIIGDINSRRGMMEELGDQGGLKTIKAKIPLAQMFQYVSALRGMSKGRAQYTMTFDSYAFVPPDVEIELTKKYKPQEAEVDSAQDQEGVFSMSALALLFGFVAATGIVFATLKSSLLQRVSSITGSRESLLAPQ